MSARATAFAWHGTFLSGLLGAACGTVDTGPDFQIASVVYDQSYFYCRVEPVLFSQSCGSGEGNEAGSCHFDVTPFRLTLHDPVPIPCDGLVPRGPIPAEAQDNYAAASGQMSPDPEQADLLNRPLRNKLHPRKIFDRDSPEADVIRTWATQFTSR